MDKARLATLAFLGALLSLGAVSIITPAQKTLVIATTTSLYDTGLLDFLKASFESAKPGVLVKFVAVGTGRALEMGARGDADLVLVHSPVLEEEFVGKGHGIHRITFMANDFVVVGPPGDPARITGMGVLAAFARLAEAGRSMNTLFVSRADGSGTNVLELGVWKELGIAPSGEPWYLETGSGMGATLRLTGEKGGYTLVDRSTWLALGSDLPLKIIVEGGPKLLNVYSAILVNPKIHPNVNFVMAERFVAFLVSEEGQKLIDEYNKDGAKLFVPLFGRTGEFGLPSQDEEVSFWKSRLEEYRRAIG